MLKSDQPYPQLQDDARRELPCTQAAAQAGTAQEVDQHPLPPPEEVEEAAHHHGLHTHLDHIVRDALPPVVIGEHEEGPKVTKHFPPPPSYFKEEVFPSTTAPLPPLTWQASPPTSLFSTHA
jgi:hypothetical protein